MDIKQDIETMSNDEVNLYDCWKVIVKRKKIFLGIFLVPLIIVTIISLIMPRYYRGESEITNPIIPASNIVNLVGNVDDAKKVKIFAGNSGAIKSVLVLLPKKATDKVSIVIDAKTEDIATQAFKDIFNYISNLPEIKGNIANVQAENDLKLDRLIEETDFKIKKIKEAREANLIFLNDMSDMIKKRKITIVNFNPADLVRKDGDLSLEIKNLEQAKADALKKKELNVKVDVGILGPPAITKQPTSAQIKQIIIITVILSLMVGIFVVFFLDYIERMKARENSNTY